MGLFDRLFGRKGKKQEISVIKASELAGFVQDIERKQSEQRFSEAEPVLEDIASMVAGVLEDIESIDSAELPERTPERIKTILKTSKPIFIKVMKDSCAGLEKTPGILGLDAYRRRLDDFINSAPKTILGQGRYLHYPFNEELGKMRNDLRLLYEKKKELDALLKEDACIGLMEDANALIDLLSRKDALDSEEKSLMKALKEKEDSEKELSRACSALDETDSFKAYLTENNNLKDLIQMRGLLENDLLNLSSPIKKAVKVALHSPGEKDFEGLSRRELSSYSDDPVEGLTSMTPEQRNGFFANLKKILGHESSGLREEKLGKALSKIDEALSPETEKKISALVSLRNEKKRISQLIKESPYLSKKAELERDIERSEREVAQLRMDEGKIRKKIMETEKETSDLKTGLEERLGGITGKKVFLGL